MTLPLIRRDRGRIPQYAIARVCLMCGNRIAAHLWPVAFCEPRCARRRARLEKEVGR